MRSNCSILVAHTFSARGWKDRCDTPTNFFFHVPEHTPEEIHKCVSLVCIVLVEYLNFSNWATIGLFISIFIGTAVMYKIFRCKPGNSRLKLKQQ